MLGIQSGNMVNDVMVIDYLDF